MLPLRNGRSRKLGASCLVFVAAMVCLDVGAAEPKAEKSKAAKPAAKPKASPGDKAASISNIPLPIGHEIKGLVLPDIDTQGHLRSRFEANTAMRLDEERIEFKGLKMTSFTPDDKIDLAMDAPVSTYNLNTRELSSQARTTITRSDFQISGDALQFSTADRKGTLTGNVKMVITSQPKASAKKPK